MNGEIEMWIEISERLEKELGMINMMREEDDRCVRDEGERNVRDKEEVAEITEIEMT